MNKQVPQRSYAGQNGAAWDRCWTPWHGAAPLFPYLPPHARIWECCAGDGWLAQWLREAGHTVLENDYKTGHDSLVWAPHPDEYDIVVTNPPWSLKYKFIKRLYGLNKPWALLVPYATPFAAGAKKTRDAAGASWEELRLDKRINFHMPGSGFVNNGAQLMSIWLCWRLLPAPIVDAQLPDPRPEHRLIKPSKKRPITRSDVVAWLAERIPGTGPLSRDDVARLILEARQNKNAISAIEQTTFLEAA
jgi:hypothetical protein